MKKKASLLVYGPCSNAGDVLIYQSIKQLFDKDINFNYKHIRMDKLEKLDDIIIIGPGGILSGSYKPDEKPDEWLIRHLDLEKIKSYKNTNRKIVFFGTGTNTPESANKSQKPFNNYSEKVIRDLISLSKGVFLRGKTDILRISSFTNTNDINKFKFQPCPSMFLDRLFPQKCNKTDKIAINLPFYKELNKNNYLTHPINKFINYANSIGLEVEFVPNHTIDVNKYVFEIFDNVLLTEKTKNAIINSSEYSFLQTVMEEEWKNYINIADRFCNYRFAFGTRLHGWLPFMSYDTPSLFLSSNPIRRPMSIDYFNNPIYTAKYSYNSKNLTLVVDNMIERLNYFIRNENSLVTNIKESKEYLWEVTNKNKNIMLDEL